MTHWKRHWFWKRLKAGGEGDNRGWDGWMASPTQWTRVWASSRSWWWTGKPVMLQSMALQRVQHNWATELNWFFSTDMPVYSCQESTEQRCMNLFLDSIFCCIDLSIMIALHLCFYFCSFLKTKSVYIFYPCFF